MGNIATIDMGIVIMRCAIFDKRNRLFPMQMKREILQNEPTCTQFYFAHELSFYSIEHGGTYHFFQFNILQANEFVASTEFSYLCQFLQEIYTDRATIEFSERQLADFFSSIQHRK